MLLYMVMLDNMLEVNCFFDAFHLEELACVGPHVRIVHNSLLIALQNNIAIFIAH